MAFSLLKIQHVSFEIFIFVLECPLAMIMCYGLCILDFPREVEKRIEFDFLQVFFMRMIV